MILNIFLICQKLDMPIFKIRPYLNLVIFTILSDH